jgi:uncharacterized integral membrane protein
LSIFAEGRLLMTPKRISILVVALLFATFVAQNAEVVEVQFLFWKTEASRALVLLGTFAFGVVGGWLSSWLRKKETRTKSPGEQ